MGSAVNHQSQARLVDCGRSESTARSRSLCDRTIGNSNLAAANRLRWWSERRHPGNLRECALYVSIAYGIKM